jgi:hypothetical protein
MNTLSNFSQFALTRSEMRAVSGGQCYYICFGGGKDGKGALGAPMPGNKSKVMASAAECGGRWCCSSCNTASWCVGC